MCLYVCACEYNAHKGRRRALDPLEMESQAVGHHPTWLLGTEPGHSARTTPLNSEAIFPAMMRAHGLTYMCLKRRNCWKYCGVLVLEAAGKGQSRRQSRG